MNESRRPGDHGVDDRSGVLDTRPERKRLAREQLAADGNVGAQILFAAADVLVNGNLVSFDEGIVLEEIRRVLGVVLA